VSYPSDLETVLAYQNGNAPTVPDHTELHRTIASVLNALQAKVGVDGSDVPASHDYKIRILEEAIENIDVTVDISDVTGLQAVLDGKASLVHSHGIIDVDGLQAALDGKASVSHTHGISDVTGLQTALDGKAASSHSHAIGDVTGLQGALDGKAASSHTHTASQVTDFATAADARIEAQKGQNNGLATLGSDGKVPSIQLPSYVDDVLEFANLAAFPATGSSGVMYIALDTGKLYRWSGSAYVEIVGSPGSTDAVPEGSSNLYHTTTRARTAAVLNTLAGSQTDQAPSVSSVKTALNGKSDTSHTHDLSSLSGVLPATKGGTGRSSYQAGALLWYDSSVSSLAFDEEDVWRNPANGRLGFGIGLTDVADMDAKVTVRPGFECTGTPDACSTYGDSTACGDAGCTWNENGSCSAYGDETACNEDPECSWNPGTACSVFGTSEECNAQSPCAWNEYACSEFNGTDEGTCEGHAGCTWDTSPCSEFNGNSSACGAQAGCSYPGNLGDCSLLDQTGCGTTTGCTQNFEYDCSQHHNDSSSCATHSGDGCSFSATSCSTWDGDQTACEANGCTYEDPSCTGTSSSGTCDGPTGGYTGCSGSYDDGSCTGNYDLGTCSGSYGTPGCTGVFGTACEEDPFCNGTPDACDTYGETDCETYGCTWAEEMTEHWMGDGMIDGDLTVGGQTQTATLKATSLISGRVPYIGSGGLFMDSSNFTFNGTLLTANTLSVSSGGATVAGALKVIDGFGCAKASISLTANQNAWNPSAKTYWLVTSDASREIRGISAQFDGRMVVITNVGSNNIVFMHQNTSAVSFWRFKFSTGADITLTPDHTLTIIYDDATQRWRDIALR
jgi:hypothetical protein